jgi:hypothetical protein
MGFWNTVKRVGAGVATGGLSEGVSLAQKLGQDSASAVQQREQLAGQGAAASGFADQGQANYGAMTAEAQQMREALRRRAGGQDSMSSEQLRQGLQQQLAQQRSMAAGAAPQNAAMAARTAAMGMGRASSGMAGQAAMAGIAERQGAEKQLADMIMGGRQQDMGVALGSRQNATSAYGGVTPEKSWMEKYGPAIVGGATMAAKGGA